MKKIVVLDFDKTLTYKDTIFPFFKYATKKNVSYPFKLGIYLGLMVLSKSGLISNFRLKDLGIKIFLKNLNKTQLEEKFLKFRNEIKMNKIFYKFNFNEENTIYYVVTASFEDYVKYFFPKNVKVIGSKIKFEKGHPVGLYFNSYKEAKLKALKKEKVNKIDIFYTDSFSDYPLAKISDKIVIVKGEKEIECNDFNSFMRFFKNEYPNF